MNRWAVAARLVGTVLAGGCGRTPCTWCEEDSTAAGSGEANSDEPDDDGNGQMSVRRYIATRHLSLSDDEVDAVVLATPGHDDANVEIRVVPPGSQDLELIASVDVPSESASRIDLSVAATSSDRTAVVEGGIYVLDADGPVTAVQYSPADISNGNDTTLLSPSTSLGTTYVVASYPGRTSISPHGAPSWVDITVLENGTMVEWTPLTATTEAADGISSVGPGQTGRVVLNRWQTLRLTATGPDGPAQADLSGTLVTATSPVVAVSGTRCAQVPATEAYPPFAGCDPLLQQLVPVERWGQTHVAARSAVRNAERHHWRIYAGAPGVSVTTDPEQPGTPHTFGQTGEFIELELANATSFVIDADGPVLPVQYLQSAYLPEFDLTNGTAQGDAAMLQSVPVSSFVPGAIAYSPPGFDRSFVQIVRAIGGGVVTVDGVEASGFESIADRFEFAEVAVASGAHVVTAETPIGVMALGYSDVATNTSCDGPCFSSYAHWAAGDR